MKKISLKLLVFLTICLMSVFSMQPTAKAVVQGNSVQLYMEGLMIFTLDEEQKHLEVGILSANDGHELRIRTFSRSPSASWEEMAPVSLSDNELRQYQTGQISLSGQGTITSIPPSAELQNSEMWGRFDLIPDIEEVLGRKVVLNRDLVKPVLTVTGVDFFSVLKPEHVESKKLPINQVANRGFIPTLIVERDQVHAARQNATKTFTDIAELGIATRNLAIRAFTSGTVIKLNEGQELVCYLGEGTSRRELFKVEYAPDREAKVVIENAVVQQSNAPETADHHPVADDDPINFFTFSIITTRSIAWTMRKNTRLPTKRCCWITQTKSRD